MFTWEEAGQGDVTMPTQPALVGLHGELAIYQALSQELDLYYLI